MWLLLLGLGALFLDRVKLPGPVAALPCPPPPAARLALYFLVAALLRLLICDARLRALERRGRRAAPAGPLGLSVPPPGLIEVGAGVGKGVAEAVMGDVVGAAVAASSLLLRFIASRRPEARLAAARASERRRAVRREQLRAACCIVGVGLVCAGVAWWPLVSPRAVSMAQAAILRLER